MYNTLIQKLPNMQYYYGPMSKQQAYDNLNNGTAVNIGMYWYIGSNTAINSLDFMSINSNTTQEYFDTYITQEPQ